MNPIIDKQHAIHRLVVVVVVVVVDQKDVAGSIEKVDAAVLQTTIKQRASCSKTTSQHPQTGKSKRRANVIEIASNYDSAGFKEGN